MSTLDDLLDQGDERRDSTREALRTAGAYVRAGLYWTGWLLAKLLVGVLWVVAGLCYGIGWCASRAWPALCWGGRAIRLGWQDARRPDGPPR